MQLFITHVQAIQKCMEHKPLEPLRGLYAGRIIPLRPLSILSTFWRFLHDIKLIYSTSPLSINGAWGRIARRQTGDITKKFQYHIAGGC